MNETQKFASSVFEFFFLSPGNDWGFFSLSPSFFFSPSLIFLNLGKWKFLNSYNKSNESSVV